MNVRDIRDVKVGQEKLNLLIKRIVSIFFSTLMCIVNLFNDPFNLNILIILVLYFSWTFIELSAQSWEANATASKKPYDKKSRYYIVACRHASLWTSALHVLFMGGNHKFNIVILGVFVVVIGIFLRILAITQLKEYFTMEINANEEQEIISNGIYRYIRHPSYLGILLIFTGFPLISDSVYIALTVLITTTIVIIYRMNIEEELLLEKIQNRYSDYMKMTFRLLPFIY